MLILISAVPAAGSRAPILLIAGDGILGDRYVTGSRIDLGTQRVAINWHGGRVTAATGEQMTIFISDSLTPQQANAQQWADFFARLVHGSELPAATIWIATLGEVQQICGEEAEGCYESEQQFMYIPGDSADRALVAAHEYGHHLERNRPNPPWRSESFGPKQWATEEKISERVNNGSLFPGNEDSYYMLNPGEGFAEVYRALNDIKQGTPVAWPIVDWSFYPDTAALDAAEADVLRPWIGPRTFTLRHQFTRRSHQSTQLVRTPLDGTLEIVASTNRQSPFGLTVLTADRSRVVAPSVLSGPTERQVRYTISGKRAFTIRISARSPMTVTASISIP